MRKHIEKERWAVKCSYKDGPDGFTNREGMLTPCFFSKQRAKDEIVRLKKEHPSLTKRFSFKAVKVEIREVSK